MYKLFSLVIVCTGLAACGGGASTPGVTDDPEPKRDTSDYLNYMKSAYSEQLGNLAATRIAARSSGNCENCMSVTETTALADTTSESFSGTNVQISGVDEADTLKFDGNNLLWLNNEANITTNNPYTREPIVRSYSEAMLNDQASTNDALHFSPDSAYQYKGLLTNDEHAVLVGSSKYWFGLDDGFFIDTIAVDCFDVCQPQPSTPAEILAYTWPYAQNGAPLIPQLDTLQIDGSLIETRLIGNKLYIVSQYSPDIDYAHPYPQDNAELAANQHIVDQLTIDEVVPHISINNQSSRLFDTAACMIAEEPAEVRIQPNVISITQIDINAPSDWQSTCYLGNANRAFVSQNNVYLSRELWQENRVELVKFALTEAGPEYRATGSVSGSLSYDNYYFGEVDGKLAYVNTVYDNENWWGHHGRHQLSVFEENGDSLELLAQIPNETAPSPIGKPGELIYAVRFMGNRAYVVTFDKVDPLYVIDLSTPAQPAILGELEIPGFSSYIHVINDDLLLGIGKNAVEEYGTTWYQGLNIRLFDISDPSHPITLESHDYGLRGSETPVFNDPHAFTYVNEPTANRFRFTVPMSLHGSEEDYDPDLRANTYYDFKENSLIQFEVSTSGAPSLNEVARFDLGDNYTYRQARSVINDDRIYVSNEHELDVIEWGGEQSIHTLPED